MASRIPPYSQHKPTRQAYVRLSGQHVYLGVYGSPESKDEYNRIVAEWLANGRRLPVAPEVISVTELCELYWKYASTRYVKDGQPTSTLDHVKSAIVLARRLYGAIPACEFGPAKLRVVRQTWIDEGRARATINSYTKWVKPMFKWAVSEEKVPVDIYARPAAVRGLERGRNEAKESEPVRPVPPEHINAIREHISTLVWAMVQVQLCSAARSQEVVGLRAIDIDDSGDVWTARLSKHKTDYRGRGRTLYFGPRTQSVLREFMRRTSRARRRSTSRSATGDSPGCRAR